MLSSQGRILYLTLDSLTASLAPYTPTPRRWRSLTDLYISYTDEEESR
jgi:hypothetical protein